MELYCNFPTTFFSATNKTEHWVYVAIKFKILEMKVKPKYKSYKICILFLPKRKVCRKCWKFFKLQIKYIWLLDFTFGNKDDVLLFLWRRNFFLLLFLKHSIVSSSHSWKLFLQFKSIIKFIYKVQAEFSRT